MIRIKLDLGGGGRAKANVSRLDAVVRYRDSYLIRTGQKEYKVLDPKEADKLARWMRATRVESKDLTLQQVETALKGRIEL